MDLSPLPPPRPSRSGGLYLVVGSVALVAVMLGYQLLGARRHQAAVTNGEPVVAKVTRLDDGNCVVGMDHHKCLQLSLELHPTGRPVYAATLTHDIPIEWMSRVQPGSWLTVAVDCSDPSNAYFDEGSMAVEAPRPVVP